LPALAEKISNDPGAPKKLTLIEKEHGNWIASLPSLLNDLSSAEVSIKLGWK